MESTKPLYICIPKQYEDPLQKTGEWDYGIVVKDLNPYMTESLLSSYFQKFGTVIECAIKIDGSSECPKGVGFVRYSSAEEAEKAEEAGPPYLGGFQTQIWKVVTPKPAELTKYTPILSCKPSHELEMANSHTEHQALAGVIQGSCD